jgi:hypothetical protein
MTDLPSGTVTFLFTDIQGSTKLAQQYPDAMREKIGDPRPPVEHASVQRDLDVIHSQLDEATFEIAYNAGCTMTEQQAIALALES